MRWHFHKEYELHLIVASSGKVFIGDYIGNFAPDTLFLTGPNLPHNWISQVEPDEVVARRDMLVNFTDEVLEDGSGVFSELNRLAPLLARARYGIEFRDPALIGESRRLLQRIADSGGMTRLGYFYPHGTARRMRGLPVALYRHFLATGRRAQRRTDQPGGGLHLPALRPGPHPGAGRRPPGHDPHLLSRFFKQAAGRGFVVEFVNRLRISKSCELLARSELPVTEVCFESGFSNLSNFNRRFQQLKGMTPTGYRRLVTQRLTEQNLL